MVKVLYTGSFDPITKGHMSIINQASNIFDEVIVVVLNNSAKKNSLFTEEERVEIINGLYEDDSNVRVVSGNGAAVDIAKLYECQAIIRGLRNLRDYDYESDLAQVNKEISNNEINTICLFSDPNYQTVSSSMVKEVFYLGKDISKYVDPVVEKKIMLKTIQRRNKYYENYE